MKDYHPTIIQDDKPSIIERFNKPYGRKKYSFDLPITVEQLTDKLKRDTSRIAGVPFMQKPFKGKIQDGSFAISWGRNNTRNSFAPIATGTIKSTGKGCSVSIEFNINQLVTFTPIILFVLLALCGGSSLHFTASKMEQTNPVILVVMMVIMPVAAIIGYYVGIKMGKRDIQNILEYFRAIPGSRESTTTLLIE